MDHIEIIRNPARRYIEEIVTQIVEKEDWNRTINEYDVWQNGCELFVFFVAIDKRYDCPAGSISMTMDKSYTDPEDDLYYIGSYYTGENYRGTGLGRILFMKALEEAGNKNINLNAALKYKEMYEFKYGFIYYPEYWNSMCQINTDQLKLRSIENPKGIEIKDINDIDIGSLYEYDRALIQRDRRRYLKTWCTFKDAVTRLALNSTGKVVGLCCVRLQQLPRLAIGPFYADDKAIAEALFHSTISSYPNLKSYGSVWLRFPEPNTDIVEIVRNAVEGDFKLFRSVKSQFNRKLIEPNPLKIYSIFEAGHSIA